MLQTTKVQPVIDRDGRLSDIASPAEAFASFIGFVRRQFPVIIFLACVTCALAAVYVITVAPSFTAQATMLIDTRKVQLFQQQPLLGDATVDTSLVDSQVEILKSENISLAVIKQLHLTENPEFTGSGGGFLGALLFLIPESFPANAPRSEFELTRQAAKVFADRLTVKRVGLTYLIQIGFRSYDADRAAQITNAIADAYIVDQLEAKYQATKRASVWLQDRIRELREQASTAQRAVVEFKTKNNIVNTGTDGRLMDEQQVAEINSQLVIARAQVSETRARLNRIEAVLRADSPNATVDSTVADSLKNDVITKLRSQYLDLANREADWSSRYGHDHLAAVHLRNQMREIRTSIVSELRRIAESYKSDYEIAKQREDGIQKELAQAVSQSQTTNQAQVTLRELESNAQTYRALYDNFLQRYMESVQQQSFPITEARVVTPASRPLEKSHPKTLIILAVSCIGGLMLGLGAARLRDLSDRVFRSSSQVEASLQTECLAVLPNIADGEAKPEGMFEKEPIEAAGDRRPSDRKQGAESLGPRTIARDRSLIWHVIDAPLSRFTESIRSIKVAIDLNGTRKSGKVIGITSTLPNEGKSTVAASLAQLMSHTGARVILVDCDLRNPSLTRRLAPKVRLGIYDVVAGKALLEETVWADRTTNLTFLPSVLNRRLAHTNEILASDATKKLFDRLREMYDYVIVDLSPLAPVVDVRTTSHLMDTYVFVIEWGRTKFDVVEKALTEARRVYDNMLGAVLNKADMNVVSRYEGYGSYYRNKYYARYGYME